MGGRVNYAGFVVAGIGFFLTRFTVTLAIYQDPVRFYLAGVVPLVIGLGLAAFGVALAVADVDPSLVRTTAVWCVAGVAAMLVLVVLTLLGSTDGMAGVATIRSRAYLSNFLIGGGVGGTLTGLYAARNRRQRVDLRLQANRLEVLNRLLRHEILNALTAIRGYAGLGDARAGGRDASEVIQSRADAIARTVEEVRYLTRSARASRPQGDPVDLERCLRASVETVRAAHPDADVSLGPVPPDATVFANDRLERVFVHLIENGVVHGGADPSVEVTVTGTDRDVRVHVSDTGPGLPDNQQALLEDGDIGEFDDPEVGYGLNVVRLLVESYRGSVETDVGPAGTTVTVVLPRRVDGGPSPVPARLSDVRPALPQLVVTFLASIVAGVAYGLVSELLGGSVGVIGVLYGAADLVVGWITHEFHSVVFGFVFAGLLSFAPRRCRDSVLGHVAVGTAWAVALWFFAAGIVSAVWLRLLGIPASIPSLSAVLLASHLAWGVSLGVLVAVGNERLAPRIARLGRRFGRRL